MSKYHKIKAQEAGVSSGYITDPQNGEMIRPSALPHYNRPHMVTSIRRAVDMSNIFSLKPTSTPGSYAMKVDGHAFAHMEEAFITPPDRAYPRLPLAEYIKECGPHLISKDAKYRNDARLNTYVHHYHAIWQFPNGRRVSVISGAMFSCTPEAPYEVWRLGDASEGEADPMGYQTDEDLMKILVQEMMK